MSKHLMHVGVMEIINCKHNPSNPIDKLIHKDSNQTQECEPDTIIFNNKQERWGILRLLKAWHHGIHLDRPYVQH